MSQTYYLFRSGTLKRNDNSLLFIDEENQQRDIPVERVRDLYVLGELTLNTKLLNFLASHVRRLVRCARFNRTILECKYSQTRVWYNEGESFNRTILECK